MVHFLLEVIKVFCSVLGTQLVSQRRGLLEKLTVADTVKKMESKDHYRLQQPLAQCGFVQHK
jgi:hypothetical protein